jgi:hypothetical protein
MSTALHLVDDTDEHLAHTRAQTLADLSAALHSLELAAGHVEALRQTDPEFHDERDGRDVAAHIDESIKLARAGAYPAGPVAATDGEHRPPPRANPWPPSMHGGRVPGVAARRCHLIVTVARQTATGRPPGTPHKER